MASPEAGDERREPMAGIEAPAAVRPASARPRALGELSEAPDFGEFVEELHRLRAVGRELQDVSAQGRCFVSAATLKLQRADPGGAAELLARVQELRTPQEVMGEELWVDSVRRLSLLQGNQVEWFIEGRLECLSLMSFFSIGVLTPEVPDACRMGIADQDDEKYLLCLLSAVRELERYAINRGQALDLESIRVCLAAAQCLEQAFMQFDFRNSELRRRFDGIKYSVRKFENLVYEVDLALQRAAATAAAAGSAVGAAAAEASESEAKPSDADASAPLGRTGDTPAYPLAIDLARIAEIKVRYDAFDAMRESVIKRSRDVIKAAKNAIYAVQRSDFRKADNELKFCAKEASAIHEELVSKSPSLRGGLFSASLEEMAEAMAFRAFKREKRLLSRAAMQAESALSFPLALHEYLGGILDLTGEVGRMAIRSTQRGRRAVPEVELCLACVDAVHGGLKELPYLPNGLGKKMGPLRGTLQKIEGALYELSLLSQGLRVQAPAPSDGDGEAAADES